MQFAGYEGGQVDAQSDLAGFEALRRRLQHPHAAQHAEFGEQHGRADRAGGDQHQQQEIGPESLVDRLEHLAAQQPDRDRRAGIGQAGNAEDALLAARIGGLERRRRGRKNLAHQRLLVLVVAGHARKDFRLLDDDSAAAIDRKQHAAELRAGLRRSLIDPLQVDAERNDAFEVTQRIERRQRGRNQRLDHEAADYDITDRKSARAYRVTEMRAVSDAQILRGPARGGCDNEPIRSCPSPGWS